MRTHVRLWALSDLHVSYRENREALDDLPAFPDDWLILAGDVTHGADGLDWCFRRLTAKFRRVVLGFPAITNCGPCRGRLRGSPASRSTSGSSGSRAATASSPRRIPTRWSNIATERFWSRRCSCSTTTASGPRTCGATRWCRGRGRRARSAPMKVMLQPTPFSGSGIVVRRPLCGTPPGGSPRTRRTCPRCSSTTFRSKNNTPCCRAFRASLPGAVRAGRAAGTAALGACAVVYGHLHIRATRWLDGVPFQEVSLGYPQQWGPPPRHRLLPAGGDPGAARRGSRMTDAGAWWTPWREAEDSLLLHVDLRPHPGRERQALAVLDEHEKARCDKFPGHRRAAPVRAVPRGAQDQPVPTVGVRQPGAVVRLPGARQAVRQGERSGAGAGGIRQYEPLQCEPQWRARADRVREPGRARGGPGGAHPGPRLRRHRRGPSTAPRERRALSAAAGTAKAHLFYRLWSLKEALIKALGTGFSLDPSRFEVPRSMLAGERSAPFRFPHLPSDRFRLEDLGEPRFAAARACRLPGPGRARCSRACRLPGAG